MVKNVLDIYIWVDYNDLTVLPNPGIMVNKGNHPQMAELFRLETPLCQINAR